MESSPLLAQYRTVVYPASWQIVISQNPWLVRWINCSLVLRHQRSVWYLQCAAKIMQCCIKPSLHIDGLVQEILNSIAVALELHLSCSNPSILSCPCSQIYAMTLRMSAMFDDHIKDIIGEWKHAVKARKSNKWPAKWDIWFLTL